MKGGAFSNYFKTAALDLKMPQTLDMCVYMHVRICVHMCDIE